MIDPVDLFRDGPGQATPKGLLVGSLAWRVRKGLKLAATTLFFFLLMSAVITGFAFAAVTLYALLPFPALVLLGRALFFLVVFIVGFL